MSTRSGKRIHSTVFDNTETVDADIIPKAEKKTRNKRLKENDDLQVIGNGPKSKTPKHYVSYPTDDDGGYTTATDVSDGRKFSRKSKKNTLTEHDHNVLENEVDTRIEDKKISRLTRHTRKFADIDDAQNMEVKTVEETRPRRIKGKKNKKMKSKSSVINENTPEPVQDVEVANLSKKSKKKKGKQTNTSTEEVKQALNKSNISTDSFHSAAGSPSTSVEDMEVVNPVENMDKTLVNEDKPKMNHTSEKILKKRKSSIKPTTSEKECIEQEVHYAVKKETKITRKSSSKSANEKLEVNNKTIEKDTTKKRKSSLKPAKVEEIPKKSQDLNSTYDKIDIDEDNTPLGKEPKDRRSLCLNNSTTENTTDTANVEICDKINTTFEKDKSSRSNISLTENGYNTNLNTTFEKVSDKSKALDSTSNLVLNTTFDKSEPNIGSNKSSLVSSDNSTVNVTFDKDNSRISITSDDSKAENIVNTTPVLIESSMDETQLSSRLSASFEMKDKDAKNISPTPKNTSQPPITPLKREGTFTKESPDIKIGNITPTKGQTLPSPGYTPFNITRSSNKEKTLLNVTRSIEKSSRRSSLADIAPTRQTRVMFCSPMNNPAVLTQQKKKIIKSSMKGSNKSFVLDDSALSSPRPAARKRSYTQNDADDTRAKRKRLADDIQLSVARLSRPRTPSTAAKVPETTPSKKPTPSKPKSEPKRTRLPNFAALHQKQFDKMESLTDCQQRKIKRARKLLVPKTPNGTVTVLERSSPRGTVDTLKPKEVAKKPETPAKKPETSAKKHEVASKITKLPTLESLRPGFTRFGFKMNTEANPFSIPSKTDTKPKTNPEKTNGLIAKPSFAPNTLAIKPLEARQPTLPSLNGTTTTRKEAAKQAVMREKSFSSLAGKRDVTRKESRTIIKGVRTNRRFELQMKMRNID